MEGFELKPDTPPHLTPREPDKNAHNHDLARKAMDNIVCNTKLLPQMYEKHCSFARATSCTTSYPYPVQDHTEGTSMSRFVAAAVNMTAVIVAMGVAPVLSLLRLPRLQLLLRLLFCVCCDHGCHCYACGCSCYGCCGVVAAAYLFVYFVELRGKISSNRLHEM